MAATEDEARAIARAVVGFLEWVHPAAQAEGADRVTTRLREHLGEVRERSVVSREVDVVDHVNLQVAVDAWAAEPGREVVVRGIGLPPNWGAVSLAQLLAGFGLPPLQWGAPDLVDLPSGPGRTLGCLNLAVLLVEDSRGRYVVMVSGPQPHDEPRLTLEIAGLEVADAQAVFAELAELRHRLNVYRGQVLELAPDRRGMLRLTFAELPPTSRDDVVLPEATLQRIERHTVDIAAHRQELLEAGQHLKRGVLLFGPPGTGKTHTTRYVIGRLAGCTVLQMTGQGLSLVGPLTRLARELQPAVVVLEDVDLVAEERSFDGPHTVLFELLDAMDGAAADADLLFLLTTNRADLLEPALAARPGRVDVAVEIARPDPAGRRRLLELYGAGAPLDLAEDEVEEVVQRTDGMTASFYKELVRRAVLERLRDGRVGRSVTAEHVRRALDDLLDSGQAVTRALLGAGRATPLDASVDDLARGADGEYAEDGEDGADGADGEDGAGSRGSPVGA